MRHEYIDYPSSGRYKVKEYYRPYTHWAKELVRPVARAAYLTKPVFDVALTTGALLAGPAAYIHWKDEQERLEKEAFDATMEQIYKENDEKIMKARLSALRKEKEQQIITANKPQFGNLGENLASVNVELGKRIVPHAPDRQPIYRNTVNTPTITSTIHTIPDIQSAEQTPIPPSSLVMPEISSATETETTVQSPSFLDGGISKMKVDNFATKLVEVAESKGVDEIDALLKSTRSWLSKDIKANPSLKDTFLELISLVKSKNKTTKSINEGVAVPSSIIRFHSQ